MKKKLLCFALAWTMAAGAILPALAQETPYGTAAEADHATGDEMTIKSISHAFTDVAADAYYNDAVSWALEKGITAGTTETKFSPNASCTRGQMAAFLWRAAGAPAPKGDTNPFTDVRADAYYAKAIQWAYEQGIAAGAAEAGFRPDAPCTRGQMASFIYRYEQAKGGGFRGMWMFRVPFCDVPEWAFEAIAWCYMKNITSGTSDTTFSPTADCTRGQMVTFLYRYFANEV